LLNVLNRRFLHENASLPVEKNFWEPSALVHLDYIFETFVLSFS
jgi:hypothetical protein